MKTRLSGILVLVLAVVPACGGSDTTDGQQDLADAYRPCIRATGGEIATSTRDLGFYFDAVHAARPTRVFGTNRIAVEEIAGRADRGGASKGYRLWVVARFKREQPTVEEAVAARDAFVAYVRDARARQAGRVRSCLTR